MRYSRMLIPTVKEVPADAEITSHKLMLRAGLIRKVASGTYTYLPLGWRCLRKIINIVREEMDKSGAQEVLMPILQPAELWQQTGRDEVFQDILFCAEDHHGRKNVFSPTAEEVVTSLVASEISSYKQLPINLYQIHDKFRDEFRPQYGVFRSREFIMKDAYSFDATIEGLNESYRRMYDAYCRIFTRCGLKYVIVQADSGGMGGTDTEEFMVPADFGDTLVMTEDNSYAANIEKAEVDPQPAQTKAAEPAIVEVHTPNVGSIDAVCKFLGTGPQDMIKTLIYWTGDAKLQQRLENAVQAACVVALVRGDHEINESKLALAAGGHATLAPEAVIRAVTGAAVGFAGPMGLAGKVAKLLIDHTVAGMAVGVTGANKTDYHAKNVVPGRDFPLDGPNVVVADIRNAAAGDTYKGKALKFSHGIEVGHVFKLGTKYSEKLGAKFLDENGAEKTCIMGCYGIGINRILASAIEIGNDPNGIIWPISIAPFEVLVTCVNQEDDQVARAAENIYRQLLDRGIDVLLDDRIMRGGVKFKDADLLGIPIRVTVGKKSVAQGNVEIKLRAETESCKVPVEQAAEKTAQIVNQLKDRLNR